MRLPVASLNILTKFRFKFVLLPPARTQLMILIAIRLYNLVFAASNRFLVDATFFECLPVTASRVIILQYQLLPDVQT